MIFLYNYKILLIMRTFTYPYDGEHGHGNIYIYLSDDLNSSSDMVWISQLFDINMYREILMENFGNDIIYNGISNDPFEHNQYYMDHLILIDKKIRNYMIENST